MLKRNLILGLVQNHLLILIILFLQNYAETD